METKLRLRNFCLYFARQDGQDGKKRKENHATEVTKIPKTKRRKYGMNETIASVHEGEKPLKCRNIIMATFLGCAGPFGRGSLIILRLLKVQARQKAVPRIAVAPPRSKMGPLTLSLICIK